MIFNRHPHFANLFVHELEGAREGALGAATRRAVTGVLGFDPPTWEDLAHGARPPPAEPEDMEPWSGRGWQHVAASKVEFQHRAEPQSAGEVAGWSRGRCGPLCCSNASSHSHSSPFVPRQIDKFGHHRASCARAGVGATRVRIGKCDSQSLPGGRRVTTNVMVRDLDLDDPRAADARRLEVVVDGLPLFGGCQLAVDATVVSVLHCDGSPHRGAENMDGVVLHRARRRKERTYPELVGPRRRARLVCCLGDRGWRSHVH